MPLGFRIKPPIEQLPPLDCFVAVKLRTQQNEGGVVFPVGARGVTVDAYEDGTYEVEFAFPAEDVVIVKRADLDLA